MITENMWATATEAIAEGVADATRKGWGVEAEAILNPVTTALAAGNATEARAVIADQLAQVAADPASVRGMYLEAVLHEVEDILIPADEATSDEAFRVALAADMRAFLNGDDVPARFDVPAQRALALF